MDETTKILIGTISGFVIAFFVEPVKIYFQNQGRKKNLRKAPHISNAQTVAGIMGKRKMENRK